MNYSADLFKILKKIAFKWPVRDNLLQGKGKVYPLLHINRHSLTKKLIEELEKMGYTILDTVDNPAGYPQYPEYYYDL